MCSLLLAEINQAAAFRTDANRTLKLWMSASPTIVCCAGCHSCNVNRLFTLRQLEGPDNYSTLTRFTTTCWCVHCAVSSRMLTSMVTLFHYCTTPPSLSCSNDKFQSVTSRVAVVHHACRLTTKISTDVRRMQRVAITATLPWLTPSEASACRGRARSTTA